MKILITIGKAPDKFIEFIRHYPDILKNPKKYLTRFYLNQNKTIIQLNDNIKAMNDLLEIKELSPTLLACNTKEFKNLYEKKSDEISRYTLVTRFWAHRKIWGPAHFPGFIDEIINFKNISLFHLLLTKTDLKYWFDIDYLHKLHTIYPKWEMCHTYSLLIKHHFHHHKIWWDPDKIVVCFDVAIWMRMDDKYLMPTDMLLEKYAKKYSHVWKKTISWLKVLPTENVIKGA